MSLGVPIVTSNWPLLQETFFKGTCHTDNTAASIIEALRTVLSDKAGFKSAIADLKRERRAIWARKLEQFSGKYLDA
jgi:glycosyltransferase involved in cell wall biosynthesis